MTHSEKVYLLAKERLKNIPSTVVTEAFLMDVIQDLYGDNLPLMEQSALLKSIHIPALIEDVREELKEEESYNHSPLAHVGMKAGDFV